MTKNYANSPLVEVVSEIFFYPLEEIDSTFVEKAASTLINEMSFIEIDNSKEEKLKIRKFELKDEGIVIRINQNILTVNILSYPGWSDCFKILSEIYNLLKDYYSLGTFKHIALKALNVLDIPHPEEDTFEIHEITNYYPELSKDFELNATAFSMQVDFPMNQDGDTLILRTGSLDSRKEKHFTIFLELIGQRSPAENIDFNNIDQWLENTHLVMNKAFESSLTDTTRALINEKPL